MNKINIMSENLANKIAAGEVVERIGNVVKELIENSIDAGSNIIKIELIESGTKSIKIVDNGSGMSREDAMSDLSARADANGFVYLDYIYNNCEVYEDDSYSNCRNGVNE